MVNKSGDEQRQADPECVASCNIHGLYGKSTGRKFADENRYSYRKKVI